MGRELVFRLRMKLRSPIELRLMHIIPVGADHGGDLNLDHALVRAEPSGKGISRSLAGTAWIVVAKDDDPPRPDAEGSWSVSA